MWYYWALGAAFALVIVLLVFGSGLFFRMSIARDVKNEKKPVWESDDNPITNPALLPYTKEILAGREYVRKNVGEKFEIKSYDGLKLTARVVPVENARAIVLMMHGYKSDPLHDFSCAVRDFNDRGFMCVLPYQRSHGESEGKYICFGVNERYDVLSWCNFLSEKYPGMPIVLDGVSMGASSVLMASGLNLPDSVKGIIADCGFTSPFEIFKWVSRASYGLSPFPFVYTMSAVTRFVAGFDPKYSTKKALEKNTLPVFFAHGEADTFVPCSMGCDNYEAALKNCDAVLFTVPEAEHGMSFLRDREGYLAALDKFICKCIK